MSNQNILLSIGLVLLVVGLGLDNEWLTGVSAGFNISSIVVGFGDNKK